MMYALCGQRVNDSGGDMGRFDVLMQGRGAPRPYSDAWKQVVDG